MSELATLRVVTCGSVDDGKSTLIGRMLYEAGQIPSDQIEAMIIDSITFGTQRGQLDLALLTDGLTAEREQGITIDVAYRYFSTPQRRFILADTPGHEQYTRNMATGASTADVAIVLVDARVGVLTQTRRHTIIVHLLGVRTIVLAVNKMDLIEFDQSRFERIVKDFAEITNGLGELDVIPIPISALDGDNITTRSGRTPWFDGAPLLSVLESLPIQTAGIDSFRMPVQMVMRPDDSFRGYAGRVGAGCVEVGEMVRVLPAGTTTTVERIIVMDQVGHDQDLETATVGQSIVLTFGNPVDCSRGDLICASDRPAEVADQFMATIVWMSDEPMLVGRSYLMKIGSQIAAMSFSSLKYRIDVNAGEHLAAAVLECNDIGVTNIKVDRPIACDRYRNCKETGGFIVIDRFTSETLAAGMIEHPLRRADNIHPQASSVGARDRAALREHQPAVIWLTGLSGAGKSTVANALETMLHQRGVHTALLDGDNVRHGLNEDLGFTDADRVENIRRIAEVAALMVDAGLLVIVACISPFKAERDFARSKFSQGQFFEVHVDVSMVEAERRDPKGLYAKARRGELPNFTGIDSPYEKPTSPDILIDTSVTPIGSAVEQIIALLLASRIL